ncbi:Annexin A6 [Orchesella cincta]|uniref:Annexin A6 n=1 Tax=Orchesella cincta TaxID=48709 RepID=A0A1D2MHJ1_ORCCI|nr:Annexin A6 [Orchesella cincta]
MAQINILITLVLMVTSVTLQYTDAFKNYHGCELHDNQPGHPTFVDIPNFNATADADYVWEALYHGGQDMIIHLAHLGSMRSRNQRKQIMKTLKRVHNVSLIYDHLHERTFDGTLGALVRALYMSREEFFATEVRWAIEGPGTDENTLTDIFCCLDPQEIQAGDIRRAFSRLYGSPVDYEIERDVCLDTYGKLLKELIMEKRSNTTDYDAAKTNAKLYFEDSKTEDFLHLSENSTIAYWKFFARRSYKEISMTSKNFNEISEDKPPFTKYLARVTTMNWWKFFTKDFWKIFPCGGNFRELVLAIVNYSTDKTKYYLDLLLDGLMVGDSRRLIRIVALRADKDLELIKQRYSENFGGIQGHTLAQLVVEQQHPFMHNHISHQVRTLLFKIICGDLYVNQHLDQLGDVLDLSTAVSIVIIVCIQFTDARTGENYVIRPGKPTLVDLPSFNKTADTDFVYKHLTRKKGYTVRHLAYLGSLRSRNERKQIVEELKQTYSIDMVHDYLLKAAFDTPDGALVRALFMPRDEFFATEIKWALMGLGTDEDTLTDIFCCLDPTEITADDIRRAYERLYEGSLDHDIAGDVCVENYGKLLDELVTKKRSNKADSDVAKSNAKLYWEDVKNKDFLHLPESSSISYLNVFARRSYDEIRMTSNNFYKLSKDEFPFTEYLDRVTSKNWRNFFSQDFWTLVRCGANFHDLILAIVNYSIDKYDYYLDLLKTALEEGDDRRLIRIVALRADKDLEWIKQRYTEDSDDAFSHNLAELVREKYTKFFSDRLELIVRFLIAEIIVGNQYSQFHSSTSNFEVHGKIGVTKAEALWEIRKSRQATAMRATVAWSPLC